MNLLKPRGVYRDSCLAMPAIHALAEGYDVFIVSDASGGVTAEAHDMAVRIRQNDIGPKPVPAVLTHD